MSARKAKRRPPRRKRGDVRLVAGAVGGVAVLGVLTSSWTGIRPYLVGALAVGAVTAGVWWWRKTDRLLRGGDRRWRHEDAVRAGLRTLAEADAMDGRDFEEFVAGLCRRDGCTDVRRVGRTHDNGADVRGRLPDGRTMVVQCKRYDPKRKISNSEVRNLVGSRVHFGADVAIFVTTAYFSGPAEECAVHNDVLAVHRDHLGLWNNGVALSALAALNGSGQGDRRHRARRKETYG
ncbi:restriction endonuclease [Streptomyces sp. NRRL F-5650]|uniref:restriction endonuclease n=1 Tax=Streptomyces sp. NRRL F-5650 TaxID=1463868 RepID=UPI00068F40F1|nr:restriction endonuclease [Streptomyces sp. NRRL F-5650]